MIGFCQTHDVPFEICGKLIVATRPDEIFRLEELADSGAANGLTGIKMLTPSGIREIEPHVVGVAGIHVPQTGIVDYRAVAGKIAGLLRERNVEISFNQEVIDLRRRNGGVEVATAGGSFRAGVVIVCAGLGADRLAMKTSPALPLRIIPFRGEYFTLRKEKRNLVRSLIYPVPDPAFPFLGAHFTRTIGGEVEAGPNAVLAFKREGYKRGDFSFRDTRETLSWPGFRRLAREFWRPGLGEIYRSLSKRAFVSELRRLVPEILAGDLEKGGAGVRAQACDSHGKLLDDFYIHEDGNILNVCNAPSPAATSAFAIGDTIAARALEMMAEQ